MYHNVIHIVNRSFLRDTLRLYKAMVAFTVLVVGFYIAGYR